MHKRKRGKGKSNEKGARNGKEPGGRSKREHNNSKLSMKIVYGGHKKKGSETVRAIPDEKGKRLEKRGERRRDCQHHAKTNKCDVKEALGTISKKKEKPGWLAKRETVLTG